MRATVELHEDSLDGLPPVKARVTLGKEDLSVKVNQSNVPANQALRLTVGVMVPPEWTFIPPASVLRSVTVEEEFP